MIDPWLQILLVAYTGISILVLDWAVRRDRESRTIKLLPFTGNQFDQYARMIQTERLRQIAIPSWLLRRDPGSDKIIFDVRSKPTGEIASVTRASEMTIRMEPVMHHEPAIVKSYGILGAGDTPDIQGHSERTEPKTRLGDPGDPQRKTYIVPDGIDDDNWIMQ